MIENIKNFYTPGKVIERNTPINNGMGGFIDNWQVHLNIDALIRPLSGKEQLTADKKTLHADHKMYCDVLDILETDRVIDENGNIYDIKFVANPMNFGNHLEIYMELVR